MTKSSVTPNQSAPVTMSARLREFFKRNKAGSEKEAALYAQIDPLKHASLIRKIRAQVKRDQTQSNLSICRGALPHDFRYGTVKAPEWFVRLIQSFPQPNEYMWKKVEASNASYYSRDFGPSIIHLYPKSGKTLLYIHDCKVLLDRIFRVVSLSLAAMIEREEICDESRKLELRDFLLALREEQCTYHLPISLEGIEHVEKFAADFAALGVKMRHDGSHKKCIEFEFSNPPWVKSVVSTLSKLAVALDHFIDSQTRQSQVKSSVDLRKYM